MRTILEVGLGSQTAEQWLLSNRMVNVPSRVPFESSSCKDEPVVSLRDHGATTVTEIGAWQNFDTPGHDDNVSLYLRHTVPITQRLEPAMYAVTDDALLSQALDTRSPIQHGDMLAPSRPARARRLPVRTEAQAYQNDVFNNIEPSLAPISDAYSAFATRPLGAPTERAPPPRRSKTPVKQAIETTKNLFARKKLNSNTQILQSQAPASSQDTIASNRMSWIPTDSNMASTDKELEEYISNLLRSPGGRDV